MEKVGQDDYNPPDPPGTPIISQLKSGPPSCYVGTRAQEREKAKNVAVRISKMGDRQQVGDGGSTRKRGAIEVKGGRA